MIDLYRPLFDGALARVDPERAHKLALESLRAAERIPGGARALRLLAAPDDPRLSVALCGLRFPHPLGSAAGLDKDARAFSGLLALGFGHVEVGTVTPRAQPGNPRPRLWRLVRDRALVNALGVPNRGAEAMRRELRRARPGQIVGVNLGKNATTPLESAAADYAELVERLHDVASYFALNVSSPNTPGLRDLQSAGSIEQLLGEVVSARARATEGRSAPPLLVKLAPDLEEAELEQIAARAIAAGAEGIIATNTTTTRDGLSEAAPDRGGLSGPPLRDLARSKIRRLYRAVGGAVPIVGVGGVASAEDALGHIRAGASLVQLYTALVYAGPALPGRIVRDLSAAADREGWRSITELVGADA